MHSKLKLLLVFCFIGLISNAQSIVFDYTKIDLGTMVHGDSIYHTYRFTNVSNQEIKLTNVKTSCGCTSPIWPKYPIKPGARDSVILKFNSTGWIGKHEKTTDVLFYEPTDTNYNKTTLSFEIEVKERIPVFEDYYFYKYDDLLVLTPIVYAGKITENGKNTGYIKIANRGKKSFTFYLENPPDYIKYKKQKIKPYINYEIPVFLIYSKIKEEGFQEKELILKTKGANKEQEIKLSLRYFK